jgi:hypothetical protein
MRITRVPKRKEWRENQTKRIARGPNIGESFCFSLFVIFAFCVDGLVVLNLFGACSSGRSISKGEFHSLALR